MKKKISLFFLALAASLGTIIAAGTKIGDLYYNLDITDSTAQVTSKSGGYTGDIIIPDVITYNDVTYKVTSIDHHCFYNDKITSVVISNSIKSIGYWAFKECTGLTSVVIGDNVNDIDFNAFEGCSNLVEVAFGNSLSTIGSEAFKECTNLTSVTLSSSVTRIGEFTFYGCSALTNINIPNSVTYIGSSAFANCSKLTSLVVPDGITSIRNGTFSGCTSLLSLTIPSSVKSIDKTACGDVPNVIFNGTYMPAGNPWGARCVNGYVDEFLVYSNETKTILLACSSSFKGDIVLPNSITSIGNSAFTGCSGLTSIAFPCNITNISDYCFSRCSSLKSIEIPTSVKSIGKSAFAACVGFKSVHIPDNVSNIGECAFVNCNIDSLIIGSGIRSLGDDAFGYKSGHLCKYVKIYASEPPTISGNVGNFSVVYVPYGSLSKYQENNRWKLYKLRIEGTEKLVSETYATSFVMKFGDENSQKYIAS